MTLSEFVSTILSNFLLAISQSPWLQGLFGFWLLLALFNREYRQKLVDNIAFFLRMPLTYEEDEKTNDPEGNEKHLIDTKNTPLYPRRWFEDAHKGLKSKLVSPFGTIAGKVSSVMQATTANLTWDATLAGIFLALFIYADIIGGINIISLIPGIITWTIPRWLSEYAITIMAGTILSVLVSAWVLGSLSDDEAQKSSDSKDSELSNKRDAKNSITPLRRRVAKFLFISGLVTIIGINLAKLPIFVDIFTETTKTYIELTSGFFLHVVIMFNAALATFLLDAMGRKGLVLLALPILFPLFIVFGLTKYLLDILASLGPIAVDILVRIVFVVMNIVAFYIISPIDLGSSLIFKKQK